MVGGPHLPITAARDAAACSDVDEGGDEEDPGSGDTGAGTTAAQCGSDTITIAVNPWVGAEANAAVAQAVMEAPDGLHRGAAGDQRIRVSSPRWPTGDVDATLEVWPSGHAEGPQGLHREGQFGRGRWRAGHHRQHRVVHPVLRGRREPRPGHMGRASRTTPTSSRRQRPVDKGQFLGARPDLLDPRRGHHREPRPGPPRSSTRVRRRRRWRRSTRPTTTRIRMLMYFVDAAVGQRQVRPRRGRAPRLRRSMRIDRGGGPDAAVGYDCDYAEDVLYKAFSAELRTRTRLRSSSCRNSPGPRKTRTRSPWPSRRGRTRPRPRRHGSTRTRTSVQSLAACSVSHMAGCTAGRTFEGEGRPASGRPRHPEGTG